MNDKLRFQLPDFRIDNEALARSQILNWGLELLNIPPLWLHTKGEGVKVAILDSGMDFEHPDLKDAVDAAEDFTESNSGVRDEQGHGTHVAGIVAAKHDSSGVVGVAPSARLLIGKVIGDDRIGS